MKAAEIREAFLSYFEKHNHKRLPSSPLIPRDDPTLLFTNAGMNQFKDVFLGQRKVDYRRATTSQKCMRAGGKHNDLENVGQTARHHTFFEMLGNFSFGDYFKEDAIKFAWEFLRKDLGLSPDRLYATVYTDDDEAFELWGKIAPELKNGRILRFGEKDNFWSMGETGPCGPCSEVHYDRGEQYGKNATVNDDGDRFMEIWNLVFMQFDRDADGRMTPLPKPSVDTGAGLERMAMVLQKVESNYDTDLFKPLLAKIVDLTGKPYHEDQRGVSHRVIADHIRALTFSIADGGNFGNEGRDYVLRRILRRAARHGRLLDQTQPFIYKLTSVLVDEMGDSFPEIKQQAEHVSLVIKTEEEGFNETLDRGLGIFEKIISKLEKEGKQVFPGDEAFKLYDTYGFPVDMTQVMARERGMSVDMAGFEDGLKEQRERSRAGASFETTFSGNLPGSTFKGYNDSFMLESEVKFAEQKGDTLHIVLDETTFYGESGGQIGDVGVLSIDGTVYQVVDTQKVGDSLVHVVRGEVDDPKKLIGKTASAAVDGERQKHTQRNHTATHLLHKALRTVLGEHVQQKGSLVAPDRLRFDFSHHKGMTPEEIAEVERLVNEQILKNYPVQWGEYGFDEARQKGAMALFGEKYGDRVRMVTVGDEGANDVYSRELCGGTHVQATGEIGLFVIASESAIAAGIRRIEALTGEGALAYLRSRERQIEEMAQTAKLPVEEISAKFNDLLEENKKLRKQLEKIEAQNAAAQILELFNSKATDINGTKVLVDSLTSKEVVKVYEERIRDEAAALLGAFVNDEGHYAIISSQQSIKDGVKPQELSKAINAEFEGRGGGRPTITQGSLRKSIDLNTFKEFVLSHLQGNAK